MNVGINRYQSRKVTLVKISVHKIFNHISFKDSQISFNSKDETAVFTYQINQNLRDDDVDLFCPLQLQSAKVWILSISQAPS